METIDHLQSEAYSINTDLPESDGTFEWNKTTVVLVRLKAGDKTGIGLSYTDASAAQLIQDELASLLEGKNPLDIPALWLLMLNKVRNMGRPGIASTAISAVDVALWDLKGKLLRLPLYELWGKTRHSVPVYGSGGFTSYSPEQLRHQFEAWRDQGINKFKMKVGRHPEQDVERVKYAREIIGESNALFVDANGTYGRKQALEFAENFKALGVTWFEEPVSSDDLEGLHLLSQLAPAGMDIAAGEYGYDINYFRTMLEARAVDILQADVTRCGGFTGFFQAAAVSKAFHTPLSSHTSPALHLHACLCINHVCHMEYFHDHVRIEQMFFEGLPELKDGFLFPNEAPGLGLQLKEENLKEHLITHSEKVYH